MLLFSHWWVPYLMLRSNKLSGEPPSEIGTIDNILLLPSPSPSAPPPTLFLLIMLSSFIIPLSPLPLLLISYTLCLLIC